MCDFAPTSNKWKMENEKLYVMARSSSLNWLFCMAVFVMTKAEGSQRSQRHIDRQNQLSFLPLAAGKIIFLGSSAAVFDAATVSGCAETEK